MSGELVAHLDKHSSGEDDAFFSSPYGSSTGLQPFNEGIGEFRREFPAADVRFGAVEEHGGSLRFGWRTVFGDGRDDLVGEDFGQLGQDGRLTFVASFDGAAPVPA